MERNITNIATALRGLAKTLERFEQVEADTETILSWYDAPDESYSVDAELQVVLKRNGYVKRKMNLPVPATIVTEAVSEVGTHTERDLRALLRIAKAAEVMGMTVNAPEPERDDLPF